MYVFPRVEWWGTQQISRTRDYSLLDKLNPSNDEATPKDKIVKIFQKTVKPSHVDIHCYLVREKRKVDIDTQSVISYAQLSTAGFS